MSPWKVTHSCDCLVETHTNTEDVVALASPGTPRQFLSLSTDRYFIPGSLRVGTDDVGDQTILLVPCAWVLSNILTTTPRIPTVPSNYEHQKTSLDIANWSPMDKLVA